MEVLTAVKCRFCGCTAEHPCKMSFGPCHRINEDQEVCSNPRCIAKWQITRGPILATRAEIVARMVDALNKMGEAQELANRFRAEFHKAKAALFALDGREYVPPDSEL